MLQQVETSAAGPLKTSCDRSCPDAQDGTPSIIKSSQVGREISEHKQTNSRLHTSIDLTSSSSPSY